MCIWGRVDLSNSDLARALDGGFTACAQALLVLTAEDAHIDFCMEGSAAGRRSSRDFHAAVFGDVSTDPRMVKQLNVGRARAHEPASVRGTRLKLEILSCRRHSDAAPPCCLLLTRYTRRRTS